MYLDIRVSVVRLSASLILLLLPLSGSAQPHNLATWLASKLASGDTTAAKKLLADSLQSNYFFLLDSQNNSSDSAEILITKSGSIIGKLLKKVLLPYLFVGQDTLWDAEFNFFLNSLGKDIRGIYKPSDYSRSHLAHLTLRNDLTLKKNYLQLPAPPDTLKVPIKTTRTLYVKIPPKRFTNYRVISSASIAAGSLIWFALERRSANQKFDDYEKAQVTTEAVMLRAEVEKIRTRRDIAGTLSLVSGLAALYFVVKGPGSEKTSTNRNGPWSLNKKPHLKIEPLLTRDELQIAMHLKF